MLTVAPSGKTKLEASSSTPSSRSTHRRVTGNVAAEDDRQLTLRLVGQDTTIAKSEIVSREKSPVSLMPERLLDDLSDQQVRDLFEYIKEGIN